MNKPIRAPLQSLLETPAASMEKKRDRAEKNSQETPDRAGA
jgi:hypothetical protein